MMITTILLLGTSSIIDDPATIGQTCRVLEAAYTAAIESNVPAYPQTIAPARRTVDLGTFHRDYRNQLPLDDGEFGDLVSRQRGFAVDGYRPLCVPTAAPIARADAEGHAQSISFTSPVFSSDGRIAVTEISFRHVPSGFGYGMLCIARRTGQAWSARCLGSWIT
ncbi:hypothetical protein [Sphingomonas sp. NFR04]|uniref:hypothetical protein n=1 Tax=Sphingomonas sp. NFR04 TaxID=1566283 RepID=UPI000B8550B7|nr:hypothetical protein [Sphingomonas sp. NFR04]